MSYFSNYALHSGALGQPPRPQRKRRKASFRLVEFLRPEGYWPQPYTLEQAFEVLRAMVETAEGYHDKTTWGPRGVVDLLSDTSGALNRTDIAPITSIENLRQRFHYALLGRESDAVRRWRQDHAFTVNSTVELEVSHWKPFAGTPYGDLSSESAIQDAVKAMLGLKPGTRLAASPNPCHPDAVFVQRVVINVYPRGFVFNLIYGIDGSTWTYCLADTKKGESFLDTFVRARAHLELVVKGGKNLAARLTSLTVPRYEGNKPFWVAASRPVLTNVRFEDDKPGNLRWSCHYRDPKTGQGGYALALADGTIIARISDRRHSDLDGLFAKANALGDWNRPTADMIAAAQKICRKRTQILQAA